MKTPEQIRARLNKARAEQKEAKNRYQRAYEMGAHHVFSPELHQAEINLNVLNRELEVLEWMLSEEFNP